MNRSGLGLRAMGSAAPLLLRLAWLVAVGGRPEEYCRRQTLDGVDTLVFLLVVLVTGANTQDRETGEHALLQSALGALVLDGWRPISDNHRS